MFTLNEINNNYLIFLTLEKFQIRKSMWLNSGEDKDRGVTFLDFCIKFYICGFEDAKEIKGLYADIHDGDGCLDCSIFLQSSWTKSF